MRKLAYIFTVFFFIGCSSDYTPKPRGFFRIDLPEKKYQKSDLNCPFIFEYGQYAEIEKREEYCWFNLQFPELKGTLHMSYKLVQNNLQEHINNSHDLAYKHTRVAEGISEQPYQNPKKKLYGIVYNFEGNTATAMQFYLTDSVHHFVRGALYFNTEMNDSITPVSDFLEEDIYHLVDSWEWK
tara:strand:+ start:304 stop:852 length:549 start_codon:yes stop_codon:yes gene_type:complete